MEGATSVPPLAPMRCGGGCMEGATSVPPETPLAPPPETPPPPPAPSCARSE